MEDYFLACAAIKWMTALSFLDVFIFPFKEARVPSLCQAIVGLYCLELLTIDSVFEKNQLSN